MLTAVVTLSAASMYFAQTTDTLSRERDIEAVVITGVADIAKDRKTPVAVSTIKEAQIVEKLGNQEFPEILNTTPSVYTTKGGGGFGDSRINIRGFANENIAVMINGIPVNDMENGAVYWSNWAGLSDVTSAMQVQRGLGSSKLAIASVGGTINLITRAADKKRQGTVAVTVGNEGYHKALFSYNTGKSEKGWSSSFLMSRTAGAMYFNGSDFEGYNYYFALGYQKPGSKHDFQFTATGAPQWHDQNFTSTIATFLDMGDGKFDGVQAENPNRRYNPNWGWLNGEIFTTNKNFYSKPIFSLNWDWKMSERSKLSTVTYASFGRGGGTGVLGRINGNQIFSNTLKDQHGQIRWDDVVAWNQGFNVAGFGAVNPTPGTAYRSTNASYSESSGRGFVRRAHVNSHDWYGLLSSFNHKLTDELNFTVGIDGRYYYGYHPGVVTDFLGNNRYIETFDLNTRPAGTVITGSQSPYPSANPFVKAIKDKSQIASRNYDGEVLWYGGFGQVEYSKNDFTAFVQGAVSNQGYNRIDNWIIDGVTQQAGQTVYKETGFKNLFGYNVKAGANYNLTANHNVFANVGYFSRQPFFNGVYPSNRQVLNPNLTNEKVFSTELGYGYRSSNLRANVNLFRTTWKDRFQRRSGITVTDVNGNSIQNAYAEVSGIEQIHYGAEIDAVYSIGQYLDLEGMFSWGDYRYQGNASSQTFSDNNEPIQLNANSAPTNLMLDNVRVGDAAQMTAALGATVKPVEGLRIFGNWRWVDQLYARFDINSFDSSQISPTYTPAAIEKGALRLPSYNLFDVGASYTFKVGHTESFTIGANVYNLLDTTYITESTSNNHTGLTARNFTGTAAQQQTALNNYNNVGTYDGLHKSNTVYFGFGRTWAANITFRF